MIAMAAGRFMAHARRALAKKAKVGTDVLKAHRAMYVAAIPLIARHPSAWKDLADQLDFMPPGRPAEWYVGAVRGSAEELRQRWRENQQAKAHLRQTARIGHVVAALQMKENCRGQ